ncbi:MAG: AI-2E family transporter, partial [Bryobacteraceae bacterium]|nr:AI-2E family transporter [Bryobacteraceae bacterium]
MASLDSRAAEAARTLKPRSLSSAVLALAAAAALLYFGRLPLITLIIAISIAFILEPFVAALMRLRLPRPLASFLVCVAALMALYLVGLGVYAQLASLYRDLPTYSNRIAELVEIVTSKIEDMERSTYRLLVPKRAQEKAAAPPVAPKPAPKRRSAEPPELAPPPQVQEVRILQERSPVLAYLYSRLGSLYDVALMASFVPFLVYFMLSWRDHLYRGFLMLFEGQARLVAGNSAEGIAAMVRGFVVGNFALGLLLAVVSSVLFMIFRLPYPWLTGPLSGFLSLIPYAGLPLSLLPPLVAALPVYSTLTPYLLVGSAVAILHLLAL